MKIRLLLALLAVLTPVAAWGNGFSIYNDPFAYQDPVFVDSVDQWKNTFNYGTHDYLAERAWEMLEEAAPEEAEWLRRLMYVYGTELPDSSNYKESINDLKAQYLVFDEAANVLDDSLADRAQKRYDLLIGALERGEWGTASKHAGTIASYVSNAGLFSRVIENPVNGNRMEAYLLRMTDVVYPSDEFDEVFGDYIVFDGSLEMISPYDATMKIGRATYKGMKDGSCSAQWIDDNYDLEDPEFLECTGRNLNNIVNAIVDVLHSAYQHGVEGNEYELEAYDWENFQGYGDEPELELELGYYENLAKECEAKDSYDCCMSSLEQMESNDYQLEPDGGCSEGLTKNQLRCADSFIWCEPTEPEEVDGTETIVPEPFVPDYEPEPVAPVNKREEGGIIFIVVAIIVIAAVLFMTFRKAGHKSTKKNLGKKKYESKRYKKKKKGA